jgi:arsenite methyltransferase
MQETAMTTQFSLHTGDTDAAGPDPVRLAERVRTTYERVAATPDGGFHFHVGLDYAVHRLGYDRAELEALPAFATSRFAGVGNPLLGGRVPAGATVLDHACGAGTDLLLATRRAGPGAHAIGVDLTPGMRACAATAAREAGLQNVDIRAGSFEALPVDDASIDLALSNGVVNLSPDKPRVFAEIARVLRPGGELWLADVVVGRELAPEARGNADLWAACVGGAVTTEALFDLVASAGLVDANVIARHDPFGGTPVARKFGRVLEVAAITLRARKPLQGSPRPR